MKRTGFTLVELLVVIGIIAVLVGILLPTLGRVREQAQSLQCSSNLRQISYALVMYANDNREKLPDLYTVGGAFFRRAPGDKDPNDRTSIPERYGLQGVLHGIAEFDDLDSALKSKPRYLDARSKVWICPSARDYIKDFGNTYFGLLLETKKSPTYLVDDPEAAGNTKFKERNTDKYKETFYIYDNFTGLPYTPGLRRGRTDPNPQIPTAQRAYPHTFRSNRARAINMIFMDGVIGKVYYPLSGGSERIRG